MQINEIIKKRNKDFKITFIARTFLIGDVFKKPVLLYHLGI